MTSGLPRTSQQARPLLSRRDLLLSSWFPFTFWRRRTVKIAGVPFRIVREGDDRRRYFWVHGNEQTAREVLLAHMKRVDGRAFLVNNDERYVTVAGGKLDPNRMFSREGAEKNLRALNPSWTSNKVHAVLDQLDCDRVKFLAAVLPRDGNLIIALHNNGPDYSVKDEEPISDSVALNDPEHPSEFMLATNTQDFRVLSESPFNVVLQNESPDTDDGSLSRLAATRGIRYLNIEASHGNKAAQERMLRWVEENLPV
ncbi:MAG: hypothetical protein ACRD7E_06570 [Bryobacteraceae bacterium]